MKESKLSPQEAAEAMGNFYTALKGLWVQWVEARRSFPRFSEHDNKRYVRLFASALHRAEFYAARASGTYFHVAHDQNDPKAIARYNELLAIIEEAYQEAEENIRA